ncbi:hypothetical protein [Mariniflexile sp.]|uniref:hypothetical protein n=1 Tax=Mariniflexile sp. TaxID=1979402 RepID=UPI0040485472
MKDLIFFGKLIAFLSFTLGTVLLALFLYFEKSPDIGNLGFYFITSALVVNSLLFSVNAIAILIDKKHRIELLKTCGIMLFNIPIALLYLYIIIYAVELNSKF